MKSLFGWLGNLFRWKEIKTYEICFRDKGCYWYQCLEAADPDEACSLIINQYPKAVVQSATVTRAR